MTTSTLSILTLIAVIAMFVTSMFARRTADPDSKLHLLLKVLRVVVLALVAIYFYKRFTG